ncbi:tetratricopeptide repeat protein [Maribellus comscasis]|uniref:Tetratricopeptide repeat protein n=1 Tax=Maribellus comscasis TaxID=2681766 RepID=A0A6I6K2T2_9BACT|nr:tetratricopeptide repeat protein [Maribellus comscasis]QGY44224.1 tetratricopeptide repeat protein [Maribellus comscasis]
MKRIIFLGSVVGLTSLLFSCSGVKTVAQKEPVVQETEVTLTEEQELDERKQKEFEYLFVEALKQKMFGNAQKAIQLLSSCLDIDPNSSSAMYELANIHAANNDFTSASLLLEKAISIDSGNKWYKLLLAQIYQKQRKFSEAAEIYTELVKTDPENLEYLYMRAALLANAEEFEEAVKAYDAMEEKTGINEQISVEKQQIYLSMGKVEEAFEEIEKLIEYNPAETKYYGLLADLYQSQGDSENALKYYKKIQQMEPENGFVHFSLANFYLENGDEEKSFEETKEGFKSEEVDIQTKLQMYMMLTSNREESKITDKKEQELIQLLLEQYPDEFLVRTIYADYFLKKNELEKAREQMLKALEIEQSDYMVWERILFIDNDLQDWEGLYKHSEKAFELFPNQPQTYFLHAIACIQLEKFEETKTIVEEGLDYVVDNPQLQGQFLMLKGEAIYKLGNQEEAFGFFDKAVELDPDNYIALNNYAYYLSVAGKNLDKAERMSGKVVERFPDNPTYLDTHAWVLFKKGEYSLAKFYMQSAINNGGQDNPTLLEHYGDILFMLQKLDEAKQFWEKAKNSGSTSEVLERKIKEQKYIEE